ncbi:hypothetical protein MNBD_ALPHA03-1526 [hydrothermal vent metagenome]|uniref:DUF1192 domain-containing protein n=1 Tax=hydrothermal vent metagenome TaxID=652676 RepID=A0A3B1AUW2_9ZZZZ
MSFSDFDDELERLKDSPIAPLIKEDLAVHSVEMLNLRLRALKSEIRRTDKAIESKGDAKNSAESFFK